MSASYRRRTKRHWSRALVALLLLSAQTALAAPASIPGKPDEFRSSVPAPAEKALASLSAPAVSSVAEEVVEKFFSEKDGHVTRLLRHNGKKYQVAEEKREKGKVTTVRRYDKLGRLIYSMDQDERKREDAVYHYDIFGILSSRTVTMTGAGGQAQIRSEAYVGGRWKLNAITDARGGTYSVFDAAGRVVERIDEKGNLWNFKYETDSRGRVTLQTTSMNGELMSTDAFSFVDDAAGRLIAKSHIRTTFKDGKAVGKFQADFEFTYDSKGRLELTVEKRSDGMKIETFHKTGRRVVTDRLGQVWAYQGADLISFLDTQKRLTLYTYHRFGSGKMEVTVRIGIRSDGHRTVDVSTVLSLKPSAKLGDALAKSLFEDKEVATKLKKASVSFEQGQIKSLELKSKQADTQASFNKDGSLQSYQRSDKAGEVRIVSDGSKLVRTVTPAAKPASKANQNPGKK